MKRRGFSLIELLLAIVCLAASSAGVLAALKFGNDKTVSSRIRCLALIKACSTMDLAKSDAFNNTLAAGTTTNNNVSISGIPNGVTVVKTITQQGATPLYNVSVQVSWTYEMTTQSVTLETVLWKGGNVT